MWIEENTLQTAAQVIGLIAMAFNVLSFQGKTAKRVIVCQLMGESLFALNYLLLGAISGGLLNIVAAARSLLFLGREKTKAAHVIWLWVFIGIYAVTYASAFLWFGTPPTLTNFVLELFPVIGMTAVSISLRSNDAAVIRRYGLVSAGAWLVYSAAAFSIGAMLCETLSLISIAVGMLRHDRRKKDEV